MDTSPSAGSKLESRLLGIGMMALFAIYGIASRSVRSVGLTDQLGPSYIPTLLAMIGVGLGALMVVVSFSPSRGPKPAADDSSDGPPSKIWRALAMLGIPFAWPLLLPRAGYLVATPLLMVVLLYLLGARGWRPLVGMPAILTGAMWVVFVMIFGVEFPTPRWGG